MKKICIYSLSILLTSPTVYAQTCTPTPDCGTLGYTKTASDCRESVKCPFDMSKVFCLKLPESCEIGSILYSDKSCSKKVVTGKTPIGVVFDTNKRLAVALDQAGSRMYWAPSGKTSEDVAALSNCTDSVTVLSCNPNGKDNSSKIIAQYGSSTSYAAGYCADYVTLGTSKGDWYLPSTEELRSIYNGRGYVDASLQLLGKPALTDGYFYWSSNEYDNKYSWGLTMGNANFGGFDKYYTYCVRAVVAF